MRGLPFYFRDLRRLKRQKGADKRFVFGTPFPILHERNESAGATSGHYFQQDLFVAKCIYRNAPKKHVDIGSRIDGFVAHVAAFREIEIFDIRKLDSPASNIIFKQADLTKLPIELIAYCDSISSLHAIEHFGLGRYGDEVDYEGHIKAIRNIAAILQPGGAFYFSVPMGEPQRIEFNAHRIFSLRYLVNLLYQEFDIRAFSYIDDSSNIHEFVSLNDNGAIDTSYGCRYGCGIFELQRKKGQEPCMNNEKEELI